MSDQYPFFRVIHALYPRVERGLDCRPTDGSDPVLQACITR